MKIINIKNLAQYFPRICSIAHSTLIHWLEHGCILINSTFNKIGQTK